MFFLSRDILIDYCKFLAIIMCPGSLIKVMEGVSGQQGISGHGPSFRFLGAVFANNCTALESSKVGYAHLS